MIYFYYLASTSVLTRPGIILRISLPNRTNNLSIASWQICSLVLTGAFSFAYWIALPINALYFSFFAAASISDGFVVASVGLKVSIAGNYNCFDCNLKWKFLPWKSPVSATTTENCLSWSREDAIINFSDLIFSEFELCCKKKWWKWADLKHFLSFNLWWCFFDWMNRKMSYKRVLSFMTCLVFYAMNDL